MKIYANQLFRQLQKELSPIYLISGDVPALMQESVLLIRNAAVKAGFTESLRYHIDAEFDWEKLENTLEHFSLFQEKQVIELNTTTLHFGTQGTALLTAYAQQPHPDKLLVLSTPKLDAKTQKTSCIKQMIEIGTYVPIWPLDFNGYMQWISSKLEDQSLRVDTQGIRLLAEYTEGNYSHALQTIEKLSLAYSKENKITAENIVHMTNQGGQYDLFGWVDECLAGNVNRMILIFKSLKEEIEPPLMLWAMTQEIRKLIHLCASKEKNLNWQEAFKSQGIWEKKQPLFQKALSRHSMRSLEALLEEAFDADKVLKGAKQGNVWNHLIDIALHLALGRTGQLLPTI